MVRKIATALAVAFSAVSVTATAINKRIVGGEDAKDGQFPPIVSIAPEFCGGILLDSTTVLTAAHCLSRSMKCLDDPEPCKGRVFSVRAGSLYREKGGIVSEVASWKIHPDYHETQTDGWPNDIAILKLATPIEESKTVGYARLPANGSDPVAGSIAIAAGWGLLDFGGRLPDQLRHVILPIVAREGCSGATETMVCAGGDGKDGCTGDSGGPLIDRETGQVVGIVSSGSGCDGPGLYTRVGTYMPFINENLGFSQIIRDQRLQDHCGRSGNDKDVCLFAARRCKGQVKPDATMQEYLQCVDVMQVCGGQDIADKLDQCIYKARVCKEQEKLPLGDLVKLSQCAKKDL